MNNEYLNIFFLKYLDDKKILPIFASKLLKKWITRNCRVILYLKTAKI